MNSNLLFKFYLLLIVMNCLAITTTSGMFVQPTFDRPNENVTVIIGNSAVLPCFISNLGDHKVAWIKVANMDILAIGDYRVTNDDRIKLLHGYLSDWSLSIQPVNEEDSGEYICQVNTEPQIITRIFLHVLLPPKIIEEKSTLQTQGPIQEGKSLRLHCHADGVPSPKVTWYFRKKLPHHSPSQHSAASGSVATHHLPHSFDLSQTAHVAKYFEYQSIIIQDENTLIITNISRAFTGIFECIANNSVPPAASRKIRISVEFGPELSVQSDRVEQLQGLDTRFECRIKANPLMNHYWIKDGHVIEQTQPDSGSSNNKYEINIYNQNSVEYLTVSVLLVKNISKSDFGVYQCVAVNSYNTSRVEIELKEIVIKQSGKLASTPKTAAAASRILFYSNNKDAASSQSPFASSSPIHTSTVPPLFTKHLLYSPKLARKTLNHTAKHKLKQTQQLQTNFDDDKETTFNLFNNAIKQKHQGSSLLLAVLLKLLVDLLL